MLKGSQYELMDGRWRSTWKILQMGLFGTAGHTFIASCCLLVFNPISVFVYKEVSISTFWSSCVLYETHPAWQGEKYTTSSTHIGSNPLVVQPHISLQEDIRSVTSALEQWKTIVEVDVYLSQLLLLITVQMVALLGNHCNKK